MWGIRESRREYHNQRRNGNQFAVDWRMLALYRAAYEEHGIMKYYVVMFGSYNKRTKATWFESCMGVYTDYCQALGKAMLLLNEEAEASKIPVHITPLYPLEGEAGDGMDLIDKSSPFIDFARIYYCTMEDEK